LREGDTVLQQLFRALLHAPEVQLIPATLSLWEHAARLRAQTGLKTPDALHAATALGVASTLCITNDGDFRRVAGLPIVVLDDILRAEGRDEP
jgi:predicted nucleic acid-binding protein